MEILVLVRSLKSSILSSTSSQLDEIPSGKWGVLLYSNQVVKAIMFAQGDGKFSPLG